MAMEDPKSNTHPQPLSTNDQALPKSTTFPVSSEADISSVKEGPRPPLSTSGDPSTSPYAIPIDPAVAKALAKARKDATPLPGLKQCRDCLRWLPFDKYSFQYKNLQRFKDGFNPSCKQCAQWYSRRAYRRNAERAGRSFLVFPPLGPHNRSVLEFLFDVLKTGGPLSVNSKGEGINKDQRYLFGLTASETTWSASLKDEEGKDIAIWSSLKEGLAPSNLIKQIIISLKELEVRLCGPGEASDGPATS